MEKNKSWTSIEGEMRVFVNKKDDRTWFSTSLSKKIDDEWNSVYIPVRFAKCDLPTESVTINIYDGFVCNDAYNGKKGIVDQLCVVVLDYDIVEVENEKNSKNRTRRR